MINQYNDYIRVAANISDFVFVERVRAVAFTEFRSSDYVLAFVNDPANTDKLVTMLDSSTSKPISVDDNLLQVNAVAYMTRDANGDPIINNRLYYVSIVTDNQGDFQSVQQDVAYSNAAPEANITSSPSAVSTVRQVKFHTNAGINYNASKAFDQNYSTNVDGEGWISSEYPVFIGLDSYDATKATDETRLWAWFDLGAVYTITKLRIWQHNDNNNSNPDVSARRYQRYIKDFRLFITNDLDIVVNTDYYPKYNPNASFAYATANGGKGRMPDTSEYTTIKFSEDLANIEWAYANVSGNLVSLFDPYYFGGEGDVTRIPYTRTATTGFHQFGFDGTTLARERTGRYLYFEGQSNNNLPMLMEMHIFGNLVS